MKHMIIVTLVLMGVGQLYSSQEKKHPQNIQQASQGKHRQKKVKPGPSAACYAAAETAVQKAPAGKAFKSAQSNFEQFSQHNQELQRAKAAYNSSSVKKDLDAAQDAFKKALSKAQASKEWRAVLKARRSLFNSSTGKTFAQAQADYVASKEYQKYIQDLQKCSML